LNDKKFSVLKSISIAVFFYEVIIKTHFLQKSFNFSLLLINLLSDDMSVVKIDMLR